MLYFSLFIQSSHVFTQLRVFIIVYRGMGDVEGGVNDTNNFSNSGAAWVPNCRTEDIYRNVFLHFSFPPWLDVF